MTFRERLAGPKPHQSLLQVLILVLILNPFLAQFPRLDWLMSLVYVLVLLAAVRTMADQRSHLQFATTLALLAVVGHVLVPLTDASWVIHVRELASMLFLFWVCLVLISHIVRRSNAVTLDLIFGAVNIYIMAALGFAFAFGYVEFLWPGSFHFPDGAEGTARGGLPFMYYSFVTITTLGYGDIYPVAEPARTLAFTEAVAGQLYLAIMVARMVGLYVAGTRS